MRNLSSLFEKFKNLKDPKEERNKIVLVVSECLGLAIDPGLAVIKDDTLCFDVSGYIKSEIYMKKEIILEELQKAGFKKIKNLR